MTTSLRFSISAAALSFALVMGACSPKDKGGSPQISAENAPLGLTAPSDKAFAKHFNAPKRKVDDTEAKQALAALGLAESGTTDLTWEKQSGQNGNYTYHNLKSQSDDGTITIEKAELFGVHMEGETATFDRADFKGLFVDGDDVDVRIKAFSIARPTPDAAKSIMEGIEEISSNTGVSLDLDKGDDDIGFGALSLSGMTLEGEEVNGTIDHIVYGSDETTKLADFKIENVDLKIAPEKKWADNFNGKKDDPSAKKNISVLRLKSFSGLGVKTDGMNQAFSGQANGLGQLLGSMNTYEKPYDSVAIKGLSFDNDNVNFSLPKIEGKSTTKGDVTTIRQVSDPMVLKLKEAPKNRDARQAYEMIKKLNFDEIILRTSQTSILDKGADTVRVKDGILEMTDGFKLNYAYGASGLSAMQEVLNTGTSHAVVFWQA